MPEVPQIQVQSTGAPGEEQHPVDGGIEGNNPGVDLRSGSDGGGRPPPGVGDLQGQLMVKGDVRNHPGKAVPQAVHHQVETKDGGGSPYPTAQGIPEAQAHSHTTQGEEGGSYNEPPAADEYFKDMQKPVQVFGLLSS